MCCNYILQNNGGRFKASSLSNLADTLVEGVHKIKWKNCDCFFEYEMVKNSSIKYNCPSCNNDY